MDIVRLEKGKYDRKKEVLQSLNLGILAINLIGNFEEDKHRTKPDHNRQQPHKDKGPGFKKL